MASIRSRLAAQKPIDAPPEVHAAHLRAFTKGMRIVLKWLTSSDGGYRPPPAIGICGWCRNIVHGASYVELDGRVFHDACAVHYSNWQK
jgi:hypothetical protein